MLRLWPEDLAVYLHREPVDFRKQINGLSVIVSEAMARDPFQPVLYVFVNRDRNRIKVLYWDSSGFCLWLKRLEKRQFVWPLTHEAATVELTGEQLNWLIGGYDIFRFPPHETLRFSAVT